MAEEILDSPAAASAIAPAIELQDEELTEQHNTVLAGALVGNVFLDPNIAKSMIQTSINQNLTTAYAAGKKLLAKDMKHKDNPDEFIPIVLIPLPLPVPTTSVVEQPDDRKELSPIIQGVVAGAVRQKEETKLDRRKIFTQVLSFAATKDIAQPGENFDKLTRAIKTLDKRDVRNDGR